MTKWHDDGKVMHLIYMALREEDPDNLMEYTMQHITTSWEVAEDLTDYAYAAAEVWRSRATRKVQAMFDSCSMKEIMDYLRHDTPFEYEWMMDRVLTDAYRLHLYDLKDDAEARRAFKREMKAWLVSRLPRPAGVY